MFRICILLYGLSLTEAYTVKVSGKVELGNKLSKLFKDLYTQLIESGVVPEHSPINDESGPTDGVTKKNVELSQESTEDTAKDFVDKTRQDKKQKKKREKRVVEASTSSSRDLPLLDKIMKNELEKLHLYGYHKSPDKETDDLGKPLNNVHI
ncbi:unnamed protein product [Spodoptera littoralis]|uniref:Uncharacterized protein n=1 Tax=Spodoptera littoralis TaxID=7109 RepID=A0A9P0HY35_SPOLI|nr:unnamed protein product [Spodoptera littoralis]CAH1635922.1 unnamed protein product [Spodoptera littoralis]